MMVRGGRLPHRCSALIANKFHMGCRHFPRDSRRPTLSQQFFPFASEGGYVIRIDSDGSKNLLDCVV